MRTLLLLLSALTIWPIPASYANLTGEYTAKQPTEIDHLSVVQAGNQFHGFMQLIDTTNYAPGYRSQTLNVTGTVEGGGLVLTGNVLDQLFGTGLSRVTGTYTRNSITLNFPNANGSVGELVLHRNSMAGWNSEVVQFQREAALRIYVVGWWNAINGEVGYVNRTLSDTAQRIPEQQTEVTSDQKAVDLSNSRKQVALAKMADDQAVLATKEDQVASLEQKAGQTGTEADRDAAANARDDAQNQRDDIQNDRDNIHDIDDDLNDQSRDLASAQSTLQNLKQAQLGALTENAVLGTWLRSEYKSLANPKHKPSSPAQALALLQVRIVRFTSSAPVYSRPIESQSYLLTTLNAGSVVAVIRCSGKWLMMLDATNTIRWVPSP